MANEVRENDVDVDEIRQKLTPQRVDAALGHINDAVLELWPLKEGYAEGTSPEILRALFIVQEALEESLEPK
jgi:hypothetical protein